MQHAEYIKLQAGVKLCKEFTILQVLISERIAD